MAKSKRKISSTQRDKSVIDAAKKLKAAGIISSRANLHSGRYVSPGVLRKVKEHIHSANLNYRAVKVDKKTAQAAKERGFQVVQGNGVIGPNSQIFRNRLKRGEVTGVRPVKGGMMEEVVLPHTIFDLKSLEEGLAGGIDSLKLPDEQFAFKLEGYQSYNPFMNTERLLEALRNYKGIFDTSMSDEEQREAFANLVILRIHRDEVRQHFFNVRQKNQSEYKRKVEAGEVVRPERKRRLSLSERLERMDPARAARTRAKMAKKAEAQRERIKANPAKYQASLKAARIRSKKSYDKRHGK